MAGKVIGVKWVRPLKVKKNCKHARVRKDCDIMHCLDCYAVLPNPDWKAGLNG